MSVILVVYLPSKKPMKRLKINLSSGVRKKISEELNMIFTYSMEILYFKESV